MTPCRVSDCLSVFGLDTEPSPDQVSVRTKSNLHHTSLKPTLNHMWVAHYSRQPNVVNVLVVAGKLMIWQVENLCLLSLSKKKHVAGKILKIALGFWICTLVNANVSSLLITLCCTASPQIPPPDAPLICKCWTACVTIQHCHGKRVKLLHVLQLKTFISISGTPKNCENLQIRSNVNCKVKADHISF